MLSYFTAKAKLGQKLLLSASEIIEIGSLAKTYIKNQKLY